MKIIYDAHLGWVLMSGGVPIYVLSEKQAKDDYGIIAVWPPKAAR